MTLLRMAARAAGRSFDCQNTRERGIWYVYETHNLKVTSREFKLDVVNRLMQNMELGSLESSETTSTMQYLGLSPDL